MQYLKDTTDSTNRLVLTLQKYNDYEYLEFIEYDFTSVKNFSSNE